MQLEYKQTMAVIFIVDSSEPDNFEEAKDRLDELRIEQELKV